MMSGRNRFPFTATQWQELEHQALIFKYMASGIPIPPDLLFTIKRSCLDSPLSPKLFSRQSPHIGWSCFQMGLGRKIDPEPGRCRRTDGKKWRCSKEAYPDSKYCERHMHRGKNRSRKPVENIASQHTTAAATTTTTPISSITKPISSSSHSLSLLSQETQNHFNYSPYQFSRPPPGAGAGAGVGLSPQNNNTHLLLDSNGDYRRNRNVYGVKEDIDEHPFFSEQSGSMRTLSGSSMDDSNWQLTPLAMSSCSSSTSSKQRSMSSSAQNGYSYLQLENNQDNNPKQQKQYHHHQQQAGYDQRQESEKTVYHFFDEWPPKNNKDSSWLDLDDKSSSSSTTRLSISIPTTATTTTSSSHDFPIFNLRAAAAAAHNDG